MFCLASIYIQKIQGNRYIFMLGLPTLNEIDDVDIDEDRITNGVPFPYTL